MSTKTINKTPFATTLLSSMFLISTIALSPTVTSADDNAVVIAEESEGWDSANIEKLVAHTGREVVHHLVAALTALKKDHSGKARGNLVAAQRLNYSALQMMPFLSVSEKVFNAKGKLALEETEYFYDELLPIYSQLDSLAFYAPETAKNAKKHLKKAETLARKGDSKAALDALGNVMEVVSESSIYMPVIYVEGQLKAALYGLNQPKRDTKMAIQAINNALDSLQVFSEADVVIPKSK